MERSEKPELKVKENTEQVVDEETADLQQYLGIQLGELPSANADK